MSLTDVKQFRFFTTWMFSWHLLLDFYSLLGIIYNLTNTTFIHSFILHVSLTS